MSVLGDVRLILPVTAALLALALVVGCPQAQPAPEDQARSEQSAPEPVGSFERIPEPGGALEVGTEFPLFTARNLRGNMLDLKELLGGNAYVLVWFWATWSLTDPSDLTPLNDLFGESEGDGFHLVTVNLDPKEQEDNLRVFIDAGEYAFPIVPDYDHDPSASLARAYEIGRYPGSYLLGPDGIIILRNIRIEQARGIVQALIESEEPYEPIKVNVGISEMMAPSTSDEPAQIPEPGQPAREAPESLMVTLSVENPQVGAEGIYPVNFVYEILTPTGQMTFLRRNPIDPQSDLVEDKEGPIAFHAVSVSETKTLDNTAAGASASVLFYVIPPREAYLIRYWVETWSPVLGQSVTGGDGLLDFARLPWCTEQDVDRQGGVIETGS